MISSLIVDDESNCCDVLETLLTKYCPEIRVIGICHSAEEALTVIEAGTPDLVFLDVEMPRMNGFEMLEQLPQVNFEIVFTTSYDQYAIKAFHYSALDYLLKPIDRQELIMAVNKIRSRSRQFLTQQIDILLQKINHPTLTISRIALPTMDGLELVNPDDIVSCGAESNYTRICLKNAHKMLISRTLKEIEEMLEGSRFFRVHHSFLVNMNEIKKYIKGEGGYLIMNDGSNIDVSRSKKEALLKKLVPGRI